MSSPSSSFIGSHPAGWLFPDKRPLWDTSRPDLLYADCNWGPTTTDASVREEPTMATTTKTATTKTAAKKENAVNIPTIEKNNLANRIALHNDLFALVNAANVEPTDDVENCCPGKDIDNLTDDPVEQAFLPYVCAFFGWEPKLCTESQAKANGGTLKDGAQGWPALWATKTTKTGKNAGKSSTWCQFVYPMSAFDWKSGAPAYDEEKALRDAVEKAKKELERAEKALDKYLHPEKYGRQTKAQLEDENAKLRELLAKAGIKVA